MATSGSTSVAATEWDTLKFSWNESSQSVGANTTTVSWTLQLIAGKYGRINSTAKKDWSVTVNGSKYSGTNTIGIGNNETKTLASGSTAIPHNADGTKSFSYSFSQELAITFSGVYIGTKSGSGSGTLDTIPRATTPTLSAFSATMGNKVKISTPRASGAFTHDLAYSFNGGPYIGIATGVATSYDWTVADVASSIPNGLAGTMTIRCVTYNGNTNIGSKTVNLTAWVPDSVVPTISSVALSEETAGLSAQFGAYIQGKSKLSVKITAAGAKGSTIKSYKSTLLGDTYTGASFTSKTLTSAGTLSLVTTVTDSRGRTSQRTTSISVLNYSPPVITRFTAYRCDSAGEAQDDGTAAMLGFSYSVSSLGNKNTAAMRIEYKRSIDSDFESSPLYASTDLSGAKSQLVVSPAFSTDNQYDLRMTVTDWFGAKATYATVLPSGSVILDIGANGNSLGIGEVAETAGAVGMRWKLFHKGGFILPVIPDGTDFDALMIPNKYSGKNAASAAYKNCPVTTGTFTLDVESCGDTGQLVQRLTTCNKESSTTWERFYYSGAWGVWLEAYKTGVDYPAYEEGTWEPAFENAILNSASGYYVIIGKIMFLQYDVTFHASISPDNTPLKMINLPRAVRQGHYPLGDYFNKAVSNKINGYVSAESGGLRFRRMSKFDTNSVHNVPETDVTTDTRWIGTCMLILA